MDVEACMLDANPSPRNRSSQKNSVIHGPGHLNKDWVLIHMGDYACLEEGVGEWP